MREVITVAKSKRLAYLLQNSSNAKRFLELLKTRTVNATDVVVKETSANYLHYYPIQDDPGREKSLKNQPIRITKEFIEAYKLKAIEDAGEEEIDTEDLANTIAMIDAWYEAKVKGAIPTIDEDDLVTYLTGGSVNEKTKQSNFLFKVNPNGRIIPTTKQKNIRLTTEKQNVLDIINADTITVTSLAPEEILKQIAAKVNNVSLDNLDELAPEDTILFVDDIALPATHFVDGNSYRGVIRKNALEVFGSFRLFISLDGTGEEPGPDPEDGDLTADWIVTQGILTGNSISVTPGEFEYSAEALLKTNRGLKFTSDASGNYTFRLANGVSGESLDYTSIGLSNGQVSGGDTENDFTQITGGLIVIARRVADTITLELRRADTDELLVSSTRNPIPVDDVVKFVVHGNKADDEPVNMLIVAVSTNSPS